MKIKLNRPAIFLVLFLFCLFIAFIMLFVQYNGQLSYIKEVANIYLENAIYSYKTEELGGRGTTYSLRSKEETYQERLYNFELINYQYDRYQDSILFFGENEEWDYRTFFINDTVYIKKVNKKPNIHIDQIAHQTVMLLQNSIEIDSILVKYKSKLEEKGIYLNGSIHLSITRELYDRVRYTTFDREENINYNYITAPYYTGHLDEIIYQAYLNISFPVVYGLMHKPYYNLIYSILTILLSLTIWFYLLDYFRKKSTTIKDLGNNRYRIGHLIFDHDEQKLYYDEAYSMTTKTADLLLMFLQNKDHRVDKAVLLDLCVHADNLTSALHRIRKVLRQAGAKYELYNIADENCYRLEVIRKDQITR